MPRWFNIEVDYDCYRFDILRRSKAANPYLSYIHIFKLLGHTEQLVFLSDQFYVELW